MKISLIIPTLNEARLIKDQVHSIQKKAKGENVEIIVVDAESPDGTAQLAEEAGANVLSTPKSCRAKQMNAGAEVATGDVYFFVHADLTLPDGFVQDIKTGIEENELYGCYQVRFDTENKGLRFNSKLSKRQGILFRGGDQTLYICKEFFQKIGGFDENIVIMEDYEILLRAKKFQKINIMPKQVVISSRKVQENNYLRANLTNVLVFVMFFLGFSQETLVKTYRRFVKGTKYTMK